MLKLLIALILYLPTTLLTDSRVYILFVPISILFYKNELICFFKSFFKSPFRKRYLLSLWLIILLLFTITLNSLIGGDFINFLKTGTLFLTPLAFLSAFIVTDYKIYRILLLLISIEILVGFIEYLFGVNTFFTFHPDYYVFDNYFSFYYTRIFGLSANSSFLAQKCFVGFLVIYFVDLKLNNKQIIIFNLLMMLGVFLTFGRTVVVVCTFMIILYNFFYFSNIIKKNNFFYINSNKLLFIKSLVYFVVIMLSIPLLSNQINRFGISHKKVNDSKGVEILNSVGLENVEMAGRKLLWGKTIDFIIENPIVGNHSKRFLVNNKHVHNSFLEFLSTNGLIIFLIMLCFIIMNLNKINVIFIFGIILYSIGQYGIFWNISFLDIIFLSILLFSSRVLKSYKHEKNL